MRNEVFTADDEEPDCGRCDNCDGSLRNCVKLCGPDHGWYGYQRTESEELKDERG